MKQTDTPTRLFDIVAQRTTIHQHRPCFRYGGSEMGIEEYCRQADALSLALIGRGMKRGEAVAIIADNRPEWNVIDVAVIQAGGTLMPLCKGLSAEEYVECMSQSGIRTLILEDESLLNRFKIILPQVPTLENVLLIEGGDKYNSLSALIGEADHEQHAELERRRNMTTTDDICTLIYTGGGTYSSLTHKMLLQDILDIVRDEHAQRRAANGNNALCTRYGRTKNYACQLAGRTVSYNKV